MKRETKRLSACAMTTALGVAVMLLGSFLGLGVYAAPMLVGLGLIPLGRAWGTKQQLLVCLAIGLLSLMLVADWEQNLMFLGFFGWYPALRPRLERLQPVLRWAAKLLLFNAAVVTMETLLIRVLMPQSMGLAFTLSLLALANLTFVVYDIAVPRFALLMRRYLGRLYPQR